MLTRGVLRFPTWQDFSFEGITEFSGCFGSRAGFEEILTQLQRSAIFHRLAAAAANHADRNFLSVAR